MRCRKLEGRNTVDMCCSVRLCNYYVPKRKHETRDQLLDNDRLVLEMLLTYLSICTRVSCFYFGTGGICEYLT